MASEMVKLLDGATTTTALAIKAGATALPTKADGYRSLAGRSVCAVRLKFGATRSAGDNETFAYQIYLWRRRGDLVTVASATLYDPEEIARGVCTIGTKTYTDGGVTHYEVDTITNTITACPNVYVHSRGDDRSAWIYVDCPEVLGVQVIPDRDAGGGTAVATCDVWIQELSEADSLPFELLADLKARIGAGYSADGGADVGDSVYADIQAMARWNDWRMAYKVWAPAGVASTSLFTITGRVEYQLMAEVVTSFDGAAGATIKLKTTGGDSAGDLIAATSAIAAGDLDAPHLWYDATPTTDSDASVTCWLAARTSYRNDAIQGQVEAAAVSSGTILVIVRWRPIPDSSATPGALVAA